MVPVTAPESAREARTEDHRFHRFKLGVASARLAERAMEIAGRCRDGEEIPPKTMRHLRFAWTAVEDRWQHTNATRP